MNGYEYAAAIQMIQSGLVDEGMAVVTAMRDRYDGEKRNPWNEFECGSNYARSMASYSLLNAFSGFQFDMVARLDRLRSDSSEGWQVPLFLVVIDRLGRVQGSGGSSESACALRGITATFFAAAFSERSCGEHRTVR